MRVFIFLGLLSVATALFDAIIWEAESWYKVYLMERLLYPDDKSQWQICKSCSFVDRRGDTAAARFVQEVTDLGLPRSTVTLAEFIKAIGTDGSFEYFGRRKVNNVMKSLAKFRTMNYKMTDYLDEMRYQRTRRGKGQFKFIASKILEHPEFPRNGDGQNGSKFELGRMQELVSERAEALRLDAADSHSADKARLVESWVKERAAAMAVDNMYRKSDSARWKKHWLIKNVDFKYGPDKAFKLITGAPGLVIFPDGTRPDPDPNNPADASMPNGKKYPDLENWETIDMDKTLEQGDQSVAAKEARKKAIKATAQYERGSGSMVSDADQKAVKEHMAVIRANDWLMPFHRGPKGEIFKCDKPGSKKRRALVSSRTPRPSSVDQSSVEQPFGDQLEIDQPFLW